MRSILCGSWDASRIDKRNRALRWRAFLGTSRLQNELIVITYHLLQCRLLIITVFHDISLLLDCMGMADLTALCWCINLQDFKRGNLGAMQKVLLNNLVYVKLLKRICLFHLRYFVQTCNRNIVCFRPLVRLLWKTTRFLWTCSLRTCSSVN